MRIGVNLLFLIPGEVGGTETYARQLLGALLHQFPGDEYRLFCNRDNADSFGDLAATVVPCAVNARFRPGRILYEQLVLPTVVARHALDVLWSPGYTSPFRSPCPSVVTIHDLQFRHHPEDFSLSELLATRLLVKLSCARASRILTDSQASADDIVRLGGVPAQRVAAAHLGVAAEFFDRFPQPHTDALLREAGVPVPFILTVANSYPHKNLAGLVRAFVRVEREIPHALVIVGHARRGEAALVAACGELGAPQRVLRLRNLSRETLRALYQAASLFLFPTQFEGFGLPVIEAMASGVPVACSNIPSLREIAGDAAEFFDPENDTEIADAIRRLLNAEDRRAELRARGLRWAREFTWQRTAARSREVFAEAAAFPAHRTNA